MLALVSMRTENIVVLDGSDGAVTLKLIDFGFASFAIGNTLTGTKGTAPYMAPEIWNKELYGKPVDMWAIGVTLYVLLCGEFPFPDKHKTKAEMINDIKVGSFAFLSENWGIVSSEAKDFLSKLLMVNPDVRLTAEAALDHPWVSGLITMLTRLLGDCCVLVNLVLILRHCHRFICVDIA